MGAPLPPVNSAVQRHEARGSDPHAVVCALAELCGVELEDG